MPVVGDVFRRQFQNRLLTGFDVNNDALKRLLVRRRSVHGEPTVIVRPRSHHPFPISNLRRPARRIDNSKLALTFFGKQAVSQPISSSRNASARVDGPFLVANQGRPEFSLRRHLTDEALFRSRVGLSADQEDSLRQRGDLRVLPECGSHQRRGQESCQHRSTQTRHFLLLKRNEFLPVIGKQPGTQH